MKTQNNKSPYERLARVQELTRRQFLGNCGAGIGLAALGQLLGKDASANAPSTLYAMASKSSHFAARAKNVIYLHMAGSPPQLDMLDYKPQLNARTGEKCPEEILKDKRFSFLGGEPRLLGSPHSFSRQGESGIWVSELLPHFGEVIDHVTVVNSMHTDQFSHAPAQLFLHTGSPRLGRPSMGSWLTYGLGSENENLPGFVVLVSGNTVPSGGNSLWGSGFLPTVHQGVQCRSEGEPMLYLANPKGMDRGVRRRSLDTLRRLNEMQHEREGDPETQTRIAQYELAYRMQISVPELMDISREPEAVQTMYGADPAESSFANNCLLARRLVEQGVRFVQLFDWGWDTHGTSGDNDLLTQLPKKCREIDRPIAALLRDLDQRGLLDETLVVWGGEFGRTPMNEARNDSKYLGRDHHPYAFTVWMAGGGVKRGAVVGATDDFGFGVVDTPVGVHDLQATILHLVGLDHERLTYRFQGRDYRLTDVFGKVVREVLA